MKDLVLTRGIDYLHHITILTQSSQIFSTSYGPAESDASMDKLTWWLELADWYALKHQPGPNSLRAIWHRPVVVDTVQDFLIKLGIKPCLHTVAAHLRAAALS